MTSKHRLGPKGRIALRKIAERPGSSILAIAVAIANHPRGFRVHYPVIWRLVASGLVKADRAVGRPGYSLTLTPEGQARSASL